MFTEIVSAVREIGLGNVISILAVLALVMNWHADQKEKRRLTNLVLRTDHHLDDPQKRKQVTRKRKKRKRLPRGEGKR